MAIINIITLRRCVKFNVQVASSVEFDSTAIAVTGIPHWPQLGGDNDNSPLWETWRDQADVHFRRQNISSFVDVFGLFIKVIYLKL